MVTIEFDRYCLESFDSSTCLGMEVFLELLRASLVHAMEMKQALPQINVKAQSAWRKGKERSEFNPDDEAITQSKS